MMTDGLPQGRDGPILGRAEAFEDALSGMNDEMRYASLVSHNSNEATQLLIRVMTVNTCIQEMEAVLSM